MDYISYIRSKVGHDKVILTFAGGILADDEGRVLLQLRGDKKTWAIPGGAMELGESFEETAKRELKEETNLDIIDSTMVKVLSGKDTYREYPNGDKLYDITAIFVITNYSGDLKVNDEESKKLEWFIIDKLPENITSHTRNYLEKYGDILKEVLTIYENK